MMLDEEPVLAPPRSAPYPGGGKGGAGKGGAKGPTFGGGKSGAKGGSKAWTIGLDNWFQGLDNWFQGWDNWTSGGDDFDETPYGGFDVGFHGGAGDGGAATFGVGKSGGKARRFDESFDDDFDETPSAGFDDAPSRRVGAGGGGAPSSRVGAGIGGAPSSRVGAALYSLIVKGIPEEIDEHELRWIFQSSGFEISRVRKIPSPGGDTYKAIVMMASKLEAAQAAEEFNGKHLPGMEGMPPLVVSSATSAAGPGAGKGADKKDAKGPGESTGISSPAAPAAGATSKCMLEVEYHGVAQRANEVLHINGLPLPCVTVDSLNRIFLARGFRTEQIRIQRDTQGRGSSSAMVRMKSVEDAETAIEVLNGLSVDGLVVEGDGPANASGKGGVKGAKDGSAKGGAKGAGKGKLVPMGSDSKAAAKRPLGAPRKDGVPLYVRFAGKKTDGKAEPRKYLTLSGFPDGIIPSEARMRQMLKQAGGDMKRMRVQKDTAMVQLESVDQAEALIDALNGRPMPHLDGEIPVKQQEEVFSPHTPPGRPTPSPSPPTASP